MKKLIFALGGVLILGNVATASEIRNVITDSVQLSVNGSATATSRLASEYSVTGSNIKATTMGGLSAGTAGTAMTIVDGAYEVNTEGQAFSFSETAITGDSLVATQAVDGTKGTFATHNTYGDLVTTSGGTAGTLAGTLTVSGVATVTAGGQGTTAIGQRTVSLTVFD